MENFADLINKLPGNFDFEKAKGMNALVQFSISGEGGGEWAVNVNDGNITVEQGKHPQPQLTIKASADDAVKLMEGKLNPMNAFMTGKVKAIGDIGLGMKLLNLIQ